MIGTTPAMRIVMRRCDHPFRIGMGKTGFGATRIFKAGGRTCIITGSAGHGMRSRHLGCHKASPFGSPSLVVLRLIRAQTSPINSLIPNRQNRPCRIIRMASATIICKFNICGLSMRIMRMCRSIRCRRYTVAQWLIWRARMFGHGMRAPFPIFRAIQIFGRMVTTMRVGIG